MSNKMEFQIIVNKKTVKVSAYPMERLLDVLREKLQLFGTKEGCGEGECGACSVLLNGELVNSCLVPMAQLQKAEITTIEGIADEQKLSQVQKAFIQCGGAQCGICTPGMILAAEELLKKNPQPAECEIKEGLGGNLCRCTGYTKIFDSVIVACGASAHQGEKDL